MERQALILSKSEKHLKDSKTFEIIDSTAQANTDNKSANLLQSYQRIIYEFSRVIQELLLKCACKSFNHQ